MIRRIILFLFLASVSLCKAGELTGVDSTEVLLNEWIKVISDKEYVRKITIRVDSAKYAGYLKVINQSFDNYKRGRYRACVSRCKDLNVERLPDLCRIKYYLMIMGEVGANKKFKARKWYSVGQSRVDSGSFSEMEKNIKNLNLTYKIDNYYKVRKKRLVLLFVGAGILGGTSTILGTLSE